MLYLRRYTIKLLALIIISASLSACSSGSNSSNDTPDSVAPNVVAVTPGNGATDVSRTAAITAKFNEEIFAKSVDNNSYYLSDNHGMIGATANLTHSDNASTASLQTDAKLNPLGRYTATLTNSVTDLAGNALVESYSWHFQAEDGNWGDPMLLEDSTSDAAFPQIAVDGNGNAFAIWMQNNGTRNIWVNRYTKADNTWGSATNIESGDGDANFPQIAIDGDGNALAVWTQFDGTSYSIWSNRYSAPDASWGIETKIEIANGDARLPQISFDGEGNALAVWSQWAGAQYSIWSNRYTVTDNSWGTATMIESDVDDASLPKIAFDNNGNALAVWQQRDGSAIVTSIWANRYSKTDGHWGAAEKLESGAGTANEPQISIDNSGNAIVVWHQTDGIEESIWANRYRITDDSWEGAQLIETQTGYAKSPQIAVDHNGNALAIWYQLSGITDTTRFNRYNASTNTWGTAAPVEADSNGARSHQVAFDHNDNALAIWSQWDGTTFRLRAARYNAVSEAWGASKIPQDDTHNADKPQIAISTNGEAWAVWEQNDNPQDNILAIPFR